MRLRHIFFTLLPGIAFLLIWQIAVQGDTRLQFLFASPLAVIDVAGIELTKGAIWRDIYVTGLEAALGLIVGVILGSTTGLLLWSNGRADTITRPYLTILGSIPIFALAPMIIIWFGIGLLSKVVMAAFAVFFVSLLQAHEGATLAAKQYAGFAQSLNAPRRRVVAKIIIPGAINWVIAGFKLSVGLALMGAFIGEFVNSEEGLGHYILKAGSTYDTPRVILGLMLLSALALILTGLARLLPKRGY